MSDRRLRSPALDVSLSIGGTAIHLVSDDHGLAPDAHGPLRQFFTDPCRADVEIRARWTDTPAAPGGDVLFDAGSWQLARLGDQFVFTFRSDTGDAAPYKTARFNATFTAGDVDVYRPHFDRQSSVAVDPLEYPLDELLMMHVLSQGTGVAIHGCGLIDAGGRAYVFAGQSGAGKSTLARLWMDDPGVRLLTDERVVLRTDRHPIVVYGTPWHGDAVLVSPLSADLAGVFFLHHAATHAVAPTGGLLAVAQLLACAFLPFHNAEAVGRVMATVEQVIRAVPCYDLWFAPDASVRAFLKPQMGGT